MSDQEDAPTDHDELPSAVDVVEEDVEPAAGSAPAASTKAMAAGGSNRRLVLLASVLFVATVALAALAAWLSSQLSAERDERREVEQVAGRLAAALYTYDYADPGASKGRVLRLATGSFEQEYEDTYPGFEALFKETKSRSTAVVEDIFVGEIDGGTASCLVLVTARVTGPAGARTETGYTRLSLVRTDDGWKVDGVALLELQGAGGGGRAPVPTTAPGPGGAPPTSAP